MEHFMAITGISSEEEAIRWLSMCDFDSAQAVGLYLSSREEDSGKTLAAPLPGNSFDDVHWADEAEVRRPDPVKRDRLLLNESDGIIVTQSKKQRTVSVFGSGKGYVPKTAKEAELAAMFKPPTDIAFHGGLDEAKEYAASMDRWLIVNIQDETEFASHVLNRDFWSSEGIRSLLAFSFVLWQQLNFSSEGILFIERYKVVSFPCIAILDPVTGACVLKLEGRDKMKPASLVERIQDFLGERSFPSERRGSTGKPPVASTAALKPSSSGTTVNDIRDTNSDEEAELQQVLALSAQSAKPISRLPESHERSQNPSPLPAPTTKEAAASVRDGGVASFSTSSQGFSAKKILSLGQIEEDRTRADTSKALQLRIRFPAGNSVTTQLLASSRVQTLLQFLVQRMPPEDHGKTFDVFFGHPVKAISDLVSTQSVPKEEISLKMIGLTVNTALTVRFL